MVNMATTHAGVKRSFQQMHNIEGSPGRVVSASNSRETSPRSRTPVGSRQPEGIESLGNFTQTTPTVLPRQSSFEPDASVVLVGVKGVGKSSLGVLAASAYRRRLIESERVFFDVTGHTAAAYRKLKGSAEYHRRHHEVLAQLLEQHTKNAIIILNFADLENSGADILRSFAQKHPVIHVIRDAKSVSAYLNLWAEDRVKQLLRLSGPLLRSCANFDFFNLSADEDSEEGAQLRRSDEQAWSEARTANGPFLTLKRAERDFLKLLRNIIGDHDRGPSHQSAYPLSQIPVERRTYTYGVVIDMNRVLRGEVELEDAQIGADAIEVIVPVTGIEGASSPSEPVGDPNLIAKAFSMVRRASILPIILTVARAENESEADRARRLELGQIFLRLGPEYCTVDMHLGDATIEKIASGKGRTKVIGYKHFPERLLNGWNDSELVFTYHNMHRLGCNIVKISMVTNREMDNFEVKQFKRRIRENSTMPRLICYNTGLIGRTSLCFNYVLSPVRARKDEVSCPRTGGATPLVTAKELTHALFAIFKHEPMNYHIYGRDVSWSLSPAMHNAAYAACGMSHQFTTFSAPSLDELQGLIHEHNFGGSAVVQPYKTSVVPLMTVLSAHAKAIGAVNSIIPIRELLDDGTVPDELRIMSSRNRSGPVKALWGDNTGESTVNTFRMSTLTQLTPTDWIGLRACVRRGLSPANTIRPNSTGIVCGAGGQARSAVYAMLSMGVRNIFVCNRTVATAHALADHYNRLIDDDVIKDAKESDGTPARVRVIESFTDPWPQDFSYPTMVVCTIPAQIKDGSAPTSFTVPDSWLRSPTGGVAVEVRLTITCLSKLSITNRSVALVQPHGHFFRAADAATSQARLDPDGRLRPSAGAGVCAVRALHRSQGAEEADEGCCVASLPRSAE